MECHRCRFRVAVAAGKYRGVPFMRTPCARCDGSTRVESFARTFDDDAGMGVAPGPGVPELAFPEEDDAPMLPVAVLVKVLEEYLKMPPRVFRLLRLRYLGMSYLRIGRAMRLTPRVVEKRFYRAMKRWPAIVPLFKGTPCQRRCLRGVAPTSAGAGGWRQLESGRQRVTVSDE